MQNDYGAHYYQHAKPASPVPGKEGVTATTRELFSKSGSNTSLGIMTAKDAKRLSVQTTRGHSRSFSRNEPPVSTQNQPQRNYRMFPLGDYLYSFEFPVDGSLPETIKTDLGFVRYDLEAIVERSGAFRPNLLGTLEIPVIRTPAEGSLEQVEPIAISRNWEDQLHYDIVISGKSFPLGSQIPIAFKLTPLAKVECHRIKVYVTENIQHWTADKSVHRLQPAKKVLLFEKRAESASTSTYPGSSMRITAGGGVDWDHRAAAARGEEIVDRARTNLLGNLNTDSGVGPTEMEFNVQLPSCHEMRGRDEAQRLHFDTTYENIQINHWIKVCNVLFSYCILGYMLMHNRLFSVSPKSTSATQANADTSKSPSTHPSTSSPAKPPKQTSTSQPTVDPPRSQTHQPKNSSAAAPAPRQQHENIHWASPAPTAKTPPRTSIGPTPSPQSPAASPTARAVLPARHRPISPTSPVSIARSLARCILFARHLSHHPRSKMYPRPRRSSLHHQSTRVSWATMTARPCWRTTSPDYPFTKSRMTNAVSAVSMYLLRPEDG